MARGEHDVLKDRPSAPSLWREYYTGRPAAPYGFGAPQRGLASAIRVKGADLGIDRRAAHGARLESLIARKRCRGHPRTVLGVTMTRAASTRPRPWPARTRKAGQLGVASPGSPFACARRSAGARRGFRGRGGGGPPRRNGESEQMEQTGDNRAGILPGSEPTD